MQKQSVVRINSYLLGRLKDIARERNYKTSHVLDHIVLSYLDDHGEDIPRTMDYVPKILRERFKNTENKKQ